MRAAPDVVAGRSWGAEDSQFDRFVMIESPRSEAHKPFLSSRDLTLRNPVGHFDESVDVVSRGMRRGRNSQMDQMGFGYCEAPIKCSEAKFTEPNLCD